MLVHSVPHNSIRKRYKKIHDPERSPTILPDAESRNKALRESSFINKHDVDTYKSSIEASYHHLLSFQNQSRSEKARYPLTILTLGFAGTLSVTKHARSNPLNGWCDPDKAQKTHQRNDR